MRDADARATQRGSAMIIVLLVTMLMLLMGAGLLATSTTESTIAANDYWSEGAFQAAEAAVQVAIDGLDVDTTDDVVAVTEIGQKYAFRSGGRGDSDPQPPQFVGSMAAAGYAHAEGSGYSSSGYAFMVYRVNGTGTGPRNTVREVEVRVQIGPIPE